MSATTSTRYERRLLRDPTDLYEWVATVAREWAEQQPEPVDPELISQRTWNAAKRSSPEFDQLPNANEVCRQLGAPGPPLPWRHVLHLALDETRDSERVHRALAGTPDDDTINDDRVFFSLRRVALELGQESLTIIDYLDGYDRLVTKDRRRKNGGALERQLLTFGQIQRYVGDDWARACTIAELRPPADATPKDEQLRSVSCVRAQVRVYRKTGGWASHPTLIAYAHDHGFALENRPRDHSWIEVVEEARDVVRAEDGVEPAEYDPRRQPTWDPPAEPELEPGDLPALDRRNYVRPELVLHVIAFLAQLGRGQRASQHNWELYSRRAGAPSLGALAGHGGLKALVTEARKKGAKQRAEAELEAIRNPTPKQKAEQERRRLEERAATPQAQAVIAAIRELGGGTVDELRAHIGWQSVMSVREWLLPLRTLELVKPVRGATHGREIRYVLAGEEPPPLLEDDPAAIRAATTPLCRQIYAELVELGTAESQDIAQRIGKNRSVVGRLLMQMVNTGFVTMDVVPVPGRQGRTFTYTPSGKPLPPEPDGPRWSAARRRVYDAVVELGEAQPHQVAERAGMHAGTIKAHLTPLVRDGYLERERRSRPKGSGVLMLYRATRKAAPVS